jgi:hypothetical protein
MPSNHQDSLKSFERLFHISEEAGITIFKPRPSPSFFVEINGNVVFAISELLLHNYLLPRDCPRVTYYAAEKTSEADRQRFFGESKAAFVVIVESGWYRRIKDAVLYCYEFAPGGFSMLDECAGYCISYEPVKPVAVTVITDIVAELLKRKVELRFTPSLIEIAGAVGKSSLNYSMIRMRNAVGH